MTAKKCLLIAPSNGKFPRTCSRLLLKDFSPSPQQRRLWSLLEEDGVATYHARCSVLLEGKLNPDILRTALQSIATRHEILRTPFRRLPGMLIPLRVYNPPSITALNYRDLSGLDWQDQQAAGRSAHFQDSGQQQFDFEQPQLWQLSLVRLSDQRHVLFIRLPALCADALTLNNLLAEISRCCAEASAAARRSLKNRCSMRISIMAEQTLEPTNGSRKSALAETGSLGACGTRSAIQVSFGS